MKTRTRKKAPADCRPRIAELFAYLDGELSASRCAVIERHIADCECCETLAADVRRLIAACRAKGREPLPASLRARARAAAKRLARQARA
jgi:anti-sigma factor RsiW